MELRVAVGIVGALARLAIGLQAELLLLQQLADDRVADLGPSLSSSPASLRRLLHVQRSGDIGSPRASARPARSDRQANRGPFPSAICVPRPAANATGRLRRRVEFLQAAPDRARGDPRDAGNRGYAAMPRRPRFRRSEKPPLPFIKLRQYRRIALLELLEKIFINHPQNYDTPRPQGIPATSLSAQNRFSYCLTIVKLARNGKRGARSRAVLPKGKRDVAPRLL